MIVYLFQPHQAGHQLTYGTDVTLRHLAGQPQAPTWVPPEVELLSEEGRTEYQSFDTVYLNGDFLVVKDTALPRVVAELTPSCELLPLRCAQEPLTLVNVLQVVDALDEDGSDIKRFASSGRIMAVNRYVFRPQAVPSDGLFRVPQSPGRMFCTQVTADVLRDRLSGLDLQPVWEG